MDMGDIRIKHKDKDRDTYVIHWWEFQISVRRCLSLPSLCFPTVFIQSFLLLSMASCMQGFTVVSGYLPSSQWKCSTHPVTARLSICRFSIRPEQNPVILLRLSLTPRPQEFEARHSHSIIESYSEYHRQGLDLPDSLECSHQFQLIPRRFRLKNLRDIHPI